MPPPNEQDHTAFTKGKLILMDYQKLKKMSAQDIKDFIKDVLHNKEFDVDEVDHNMHDRLMSTVADWEMDILDMWHEGYGVQDI